MPLALVIAVALSAPRVQVPSETVIMLELATTADGQRRERTLHDELALVLDGFGLVSLRPENPKFSEAPLPTQLEEVFALAQAENAVAVVWLSRDAKGRLLLELVAQRTGRTLIRSIEGAKGQGERVLALAVRELLATAFLFEPPERQPAPVVELVTALKQQVVSSPAAPAPPAPPGFSVNASLGASVGLAGEVGAVPHAVATLRGTRVLGGWFEVGPLGEAATTRALLREGAAVSWWRLSFGAVALARRSVGPWSFSAGVAAMASTLRWSLLSATDTTSSGGWAFRADALGEVGFELIPRLSIVLMTAVGWVSARIAVSQAEQVLYVSPAVLGRLGLGVDLRW